MPMDFAAVSLRPVVATVMSNLGLHEFCRNNGFQLICTAVGDRNVLELMQKEHMVLGGEQSGHIIFGRLANSGDGILTAIKIMEAMCESKQPLSVLAAPVVMYPQLLKNVVVTDKDETLECAEVKKAVADMEAKLGDDGRILLRKSGTEPVLRVMAEAKTHEQCEECVDYIIDAMRRSGRLIKVK